MLQKLKRLIYSDGFQKSEEILNEIEETKADKTIELLIKYGKIWFVRVGAVLSTYLDDLNGITNE